MTSPSSASFLKHNRHMWNFRMKARGRPHNLQRLRERTLYFGVFASLATFAVVAISKSSAYRLLPTAYWLVRNGIPINWRSFRASSSVRALVTTDTFMPRALSTFM